MVLGVSDVFRGEVKLRASNSLVSVHSTRSSREEAASHLIASDCLAYGHGALEETLALLMLGLRLNLSPAPN